MVRVKKELIKSVMKEQVYPYKDGTILKEYKKVDLIVGYDIREDTRINFCMDILLDKEIKDNEKGKKLMKFEVEGFNETNLSLTDGKMLCKNILKDESEILNSINSMRGLRYFGPSKMSLFNLIIHSFSIIAVFKKNVFLRSSIAIFFLSYFSFITNFKVIILQFLLVLFSLIIFVVSLRENELNDQSTILKIIDLLC